MARELSLEVIQLGTTQTLIKHSCFPETILIESPLPICSIYHKTNLWVLTPERT